MNFEGSTSCEMLFKAGDLSVKDTDGTQKRYQASIKNAEIPGGAKEICFAVWSETGGQDDIVWYTAKTVLQILRSRIIKQQENIMFMRMQLRQTEI